MAKIEDLIARIPDERLKKAIGAEVRELKKNKKFGLVFEEHLPETVRLLAQSGTCRCLQTSGYAEDLQRRSCTEDDRPETCATAVWDAYAGRY